MTAWRDQIRIQPVDAQTQLAIVGAPAAYVNERAVDVREIASVDRDITKSPFQNTLRNDDDTLVTRGNGRGLRIYDELERDCHASAELDKRKFAVVARSWEITPASTAARDVEIAKLVRENCKALQLDRITGEMLDATLKGYAIGEIMWGVKGDRVLALNVVARDQRRFVFDVQSRLHMLTRSNMITGELMPDRKFIVHSVGSKDGSPYGLGLGSKLFWPVFFKRKGIAFWLVFCDKFGSPTAVGKYPPGTHLTDQKKLLAMLDAIAQDAGIIVPSGTQVELLEPARAGSIDTYERLVRYMDEQISKAVLGGTLTTTAAATGIGSGAASVQNDVRLETSKADADLLSDTLNATLVRWIVDFNFDGVTRYPKLYRNFARSRDQLQQATRDVKLYEMGWRPTLQYITETYGPGWTKKPGAPPSPVTQAGASFSEVGPRRGSERARSRARIHAALARATADDDGSVSF